MVFCFLHADEEAKRSDTGWVSRDHPAHRMAWLLLWGFCASTASVVKAIRFAFCVLRDLLPRASMCRTAR
jgi:hypothetical protein